MRYGVLAVGDSRTFFSLSRIVGRLEELLRPAMEKTFWLKAEISSGRLKGQNFYCDLVETEESGRVKAQFRCTIWGSELSKIRENFKDQGLDLQLEDGTAVGILCRVQFHPVYGLALRGLDIDPSLALGEMELKKRAIMDRMKSEGLDKLNAGKKLSLLPQRIGLITSDGSAAYYDFMQTITASGYGFVVEVADSTMQGEKTEASVIRSLRALSGLDLDLVVICRGGGSKTDLFWLDNEAIAREIAGHPHPVWTGIGHEIDVSVLDVMAHQSFKTPTAIAEEIVGTFDGMSSRVEQAKHQIQSSWNHRWKQDSNWLEKAQEGLLLGVGKLMALQQSKLSHRMESLRGRAQKGLEVGSRHLDRSESALKVGVEKMIQESHRTSKDCREKLVWLAKGRIDIAKRDQASMSGRLKLERFLTLLGRSKTELTRRREILSGDVIQRRLISEDRKLSDARKILRAHDPSVTLKRGYALIEDVDGGPKGERDSFEKGEKIRIRLSKRTLMAKVESFEETENP